MKISGLQKVSLIDYPGKISAVVFTQGCNFRCPYCHNPELVDPERFEACMDEQVILNFLESRLKKLDGVTITGGEPTLQADLEFFCAKIKKMGYLLKIDTNGSHPMVLDNLLKRNLLDYIAMDIKGPMDMYEKVTQTKVNTEDVLKSVALVMKSGCKYEFRTTLVSPLLTRDHILQIDNVIHGANRFIMQRCQTVKCLKPNLVSSNGFPENDLREMKMQFSRTIKEVLIR
jgi:pyruvate formate lyase activating enzyme